MERWRTKRLTEMHRAAEWQLEGVKLRATAMYVSDTLTHQQLLMFAEDCEEQAMREVSGPLVTPR
jgi:hypothetical protein